MGKSTISQNLAADFSAMGYRAVIVDTDTNNSSVHRSGLRGDSLPKVSVFSLSESDALIKNIKDLEADYDLVIIDGTPALSMVVSAMLIVGDMVIIPIQPSGMDIRATEKFMTHFKQARDIKGADIKAWFLFNQFNEHTNLAKESQAVLSDWGIPVLKTTIRHRVAYAEATIH